MEPHDRLFVLSGGPGAGKTTLLDALSALGHATQPESGRAVIRMQQAIGGRALPWRDRALFAEWMLALDLRAHGAALGSSRPHIFDRGVPDLIGYLTLEGLAIPDHFRRAAQHHRYARRVFLLPPWPEIYRGDAERRQDFATAKATFEAVEAAWRACGYEPCIVPPGSVVQRRDFVCAHLQG